MSYLTTDFKEFMNDNNEFIYHGTGKGQALNIQKDGYMKPNSNGESKPSISFTKDLEYAKYYAKYKSSVSKMVILRTKLDDSFKLSTRIIYNNGDEYVTFEKIPSSKLEIYSNKEGNWKPLDDWNVIFDEQLS